MNRPQKPDEPLQPAEDRTVAGLRGQSRSSTKQTASTTTPKSSLGALEVWLGIPEDELEGGWPKGWTKKTFQRQSGASKGAFDSYWYSPINNHKLRSMAEVRRFLEALKTSEGNEEQAWRIVKGRHAVASNPRDSAKKRPAATTATEGRDRHHGRLQQTTEQVVVWDDRKQAGHRDRVVASTTASVPRAAAALAPTLSDSSLPPAVSGQAAALAAEHHVAQGSSMESDDEDDRKPSAIDTEPKEKDTANAVPSQTRRGRVYSSPSPPKVQRVKEEPSLSFKEEPMSPTLSLLDLFFGDDEGSSELFDRIVCYLDAWSLGRLTFAHSETRRWMHSKHWQALLAKAGSLNIPDLAPLPTDALMRMKVWTKLTEFTEQFETRNSQHFYLDRGEYGRCRSKQKREACRLPNLWCDPFKEELIDTNDIKFFVRFSYRMEDGPFADRHRLVWQGFLEPRWDQGDVYVYFDLEDALSYGCSGWPEMDDYLELRKADWWRLSRLGTAFGKHMKAKNRLHKLLTVTVVAIDIRPTGSYCCRPVFASPGLTNSRGRLQYRWADPHRWSSKAQGQVFGASFAFPDASAIRDSMGAPPIYPDLVLQQVFSS